MYVLCLIMLWLTVSVAALTPTDSMVINAMADSTSKYKIYKNPSIVNHSINGKYKHQVIFNKDGAYYFYLINLYSNAMMFHNFKYVFVDTLTLHDTGFGFVIWLLRIR